MSPLQSTVGFCYPRITHRARHSPPTLGSLHRLLCGSPPYQPPVPSLHPHAMQSRFGDRELDYLTYLSSFASFGSIGRTHKLSKAYRWALGKGTLCVARGGCRESPVFAPDKVAAPNPFIGDAAAVPA